MFDSTLLLTSLLTKITKYETFIQKYLAKGKIHIHNYPTEIKHILNLSMKNKLIYEERRKEHTVIYSSHFIIVVQAQHW